MQQTEHYKLNQWERTDRIQMEDFNHDNAKIDAALAEQAAALGERPNWEEMAAAQRCVKLGEITLNASSSALSITIPNAELYALYFFTFEVNGGVSANLVWQGQSSSYTLGGAGRSLPVHGYGYCTAVPFPTSGVLLRHMSFFSSEEGFNEYSNDSRLYNAATSGTVNISITAAKHDGTATELSSGSWLRVYGLKK